MKMNWKIATPIVVLVVVVAASMSLGNKEPILIAINNEVPSTITTEPASGDAMIAKDAGAAESTGDAMIAMRSVTLPAQPTSGSVDDLIASLTLEANADMSLLSDSSADIALITADSQSVNDFNTTYNETTF